MSDSKFNIPNFIHELSDIPISDQLVCLDTEKTGLIELEALPVDKTELTQNSTVKSIVRTAQTFRKEADVNSLCVVHSVLHWTIDGNERKTPLFLFPTDWTILKHNQNLQFQATDLFELNPYVKRVLRNWTDEQLPDWESASLEETEKQIEELKEKFNLPLKIERQFFLGNFHYHRYHILRELEGIERSGESSVLIDELLGVSANTEKLDLPTDYLTPVDSDQIRVFETFSENNVVVQGPPGTGKSQVLVNILGKLMASKKRSLVVSEKKVALEVLVKKLADLGLNPFTFIVHSQTKSRDLLEHLKATWSLLESTEENYKPGLKLSSQRVAQLQQLLDRLNSPGLVGGISYNEFLTLKEETPFDAGFRSDTPSIKEWLEHKNEIRHLDITMGGLNKLAGFRPVFFQYNNGDQKLKQWLQQLLVLRNELEVISYQDLKNLYESLGRCQLIENEHYKTYIALSSKPKEWKKFERNRLRFTEIHRSLELLSAEMSVWKVQPSKTEIVTFQNASGFFRKWKTRRKLQSYLESNVLIPDVAAENWLKVLSLKEEQLQLEQYFLGLELNPTIVELDLAVSFLKNLNSESAQKMTEIALWSVDKRKKVLQYQTEIESVYKDLNRYLLIDHAKNLEAEVYKLTQNFELLLPHSKKLQSLPVSILQHFEETGNWLNLQALILASNWKKTEALFPELIKYNGFVLQFKIENCIHDQNADLTEFAKEIAQLQRTKFANNHTLLMKPSQKCAADERELRARLKRGKALLVKEFAKSRSHISIRELLDSDAGLWIQDLIPVWLATPTQVADHFPLRTDLFDVVVFDEASQIPLPNAFGALFRSKRALVAGDEQQMSPTSYFGKSWSGHDLLHQALFYFKRTSLKHHYRSAYPELISFSNRHFYENELVVYPSPEKKQVVFRHRCDGKFIDRKNAVEADAVAAFLENTDWEQTIGIVAFSEEQLKAVWNACSLKVQERIMNGQEENTVFFKALEQVQGDEADCMIISLGYAPNEEDEFHLRFGPLNKANGYKRLNVLLTRAIQEMHFFTSVDSGSFAVSANESVNLLRRFLVELELPYNEQNSFFPYQLEPYELKENLVRFPFISSHLQKAEELLTFHRVMTSRSWILNYDR
jgi:hypothetical protein